MSKENDVWEQVRHVTIDQLVTQVKLSGAASMTIFGTTTPEGKKFMLALAIETERGRENLDVLIGYHREMEKYASWTQRADRESTS